MFSKRRIILILIALLASLFSGLSQDLGNDLEDKLVKERKNEIRLNLLFIPFNYYEGTYERLLPENASIGISFGGTFEEDQNPDIYAIGFYRVYTSRKKWERFFIEANGAFWNSKRLTGLFNKVINDSNFGLGVAIGGKFFLWKNWQVEIVFGLGSNFSQGSFRNSSVYPRIGVSAGHRF